MAKIDPFNRCDRCGEARVDRLDLHGDELTCLTCGNIYGLSFTPHPSDLLPHEVYEAMKAKAKVKLAAIEAGKIVRCHGEWPVDTGHGVYACRLCGSVQTIIDEAE